MTTFPSMRRLLKLVLIAFFLFCILFYTPMSFIVVGAYHIWQGASELFDRLRGVPDNNDLIPAISARQLASAVSEFATVKTAILEFYQTNNHLPSTTDMEIPLTSSGNLRLLENGTIQVVIDRGSGAAVYWLPLVVNDRINWKCVSPNIVNIGRMLSGCSVDVTYGGDSLKPDKPSEKLAGLGRDAEKFALSISEFASVKPEIADYYLRHGRLPRATDMRKPLTPSGNVRLLENGTVEAIVDQNAEIIMYWRPVPKNSREGLNWECVSLRTVNPERLLPNCRIDPTYDKNAPVVLDTRFSEYLTFAFKHDDTKWLTGDSKGRLQRLTQKLITSQKGEIFEIHLSGYTDPIGGLDSNVKLAESRAISVREALVASGVNRSLISIRAVGVDPNPKHDCQESFARNDRIRCFADSRRVDIAVILRKQL